MQPRDGRGYALPRLCRCVSAPARVGFGWRDAVYAAGVALLAVLCAVL